MAKAVAGALPLRPAAEASSAMFSAPCWPGCQQKNRAGTITLRIEDLDKPRCPAGS